MERDERRRRREQQQREVEAAASQREASQRESQRLERLVQQGMLSAMVAPFEYQVLVKRDLLAYVKTERFPQRLAAHEAQTLLSKRIEQKLKPFRDKRGVADLLQSGRSLALLRTAGANWHVEPAQQARREIEATLKREVDVEWDEADVRARAEEILADWD